MSIPQVQQYFPNLDGLADPKVVQAHKLAWIAIGDLSKGVDALNTKVQSINTSSSTSSPGSSTGTTSTTTGSTITTLGTVNQQSANTYTTQQTDNGALLYINNSTAFSLSLNSAVTAPFFLFAMNVGPGTVTATPTSGTINGGTNLSVAQGYGIICFFDGTNWECFVLPPVPKTFTAITNQFLRSYDQTTQQFSSAQINFANLSGSATSAQLPKATQVSYGAILAIPLVASQWVQYIDNTGTPQLAQPTSADVVPASGTTAARPTVHATGQPYFDTTLGKPIWWNGTNWVDATGTVV